MFSVAARHHERWEATARVRVEHAFGGPGRIDDLKSGHRLITDEMKKRS
jgi:hypothetical protein